MSLIDLIKRRKNTVNQESEGINLLTHFIYKFEKRTFTFKRLKNRYSGLRGEELLRLIQEELYSMLVLYRYATRVKKYTDKKRIPQVEIKLVGKASTMNRYNPLDVEMQIKTETLDK